MKKLNALVLASCLLAIPALRAQSVSASASSHVQEALSNGAKAIAEKRFADAEKWFRTALRLSPDNPMAHMELGVAELRMGRAQEATTELRDAIRRAPDLQGPHLFLGIACAQMHLQEEAIAALQREIDLDGKNTQALMWLGIVELQAGHPEKATAPLDRAAELAPDDLNILDYRGKAHNDVAYYSYAHMAMLAPNSWHVHKVQAEYYAHEKKHKDAIAEFLEAIKQAPNNSDLYEELGDEYRQATTLDLAQKAYAKELDLSPNNPVAMFNLGKIDIETNRTEEGLALLEKVVAAFADVPAAYFYMGVGQLEAGHLDKALAALEKARTMHPEPDLAPRVEYELSRVYHKLGQTEKSERAIKEYARLKAQNANRSPLLERGDQEPETTNRTSETAAQPQ